MNERVKDLRKELELTLEKFGEQLGVGKNAISRIETAKSKLTDQMIKGICNANWDGKHVNETWLRTGQGEMFIKTPDNTLEKLKQEYDLDSFSYNLICEYLKLDSKKRDAVRDYFHNVLSYEEISETAATFQDTRSLTREQLHAALDRELDLEEETAIRSKALRKSG